MPTARAAQPACFADEVVRAITVMDRASIARSLADLSAGNPTFPIDLTPDWIEAQPIESLRHVFAAICLQCRHVPRDTSDLGAGELSPAA